MRHGQSEANVNKIVSGSRETPLSELGRRQAQLAAKEVGQHKIDLIVTSPMERAKQTAFIVADNLGYPRENITVLNSLCERHLGELEGKSYAADPVLSGDFKDTEGTPGMEPIGDFHSRIQHAMRQLHSFKVHRNILVVCHNNVGRMLRVVAENKPALSLYDTTRLENGRIYKLF